MTKAIEEVKGQRHAPAALYPWERPGTHCTGGWVGTRAGLDTGVKTRPTRIRFPDIPWFVQQYITIAKYVVLKTNSSKHFFIEGSVIYVICRRSSFME
jgi:hypothetical protein